MSSGMPVISTTRARHRPTVPPMSMAAIRRTILAPLASSMTRIAVAASGDRHAGDAVDDPGLGGFVAAEPGEAQDEQQGGDDLGGVGGGHSGHTVSPSRTSTACVGSRQNHRRC